MEVLRFTPLKPIMMRVQRLTFDDSVADTHRSPGISPTGPVLRRSAPYQSWSASAFVFHVFHQRRIGRPALLVVVSVVPVLPTPSPSTALVASDRDVNQRQKAADGGLLDLVFSVCCGRLHGKLARYFSTSTHCSGANCCQVSVS